MLTVGGMQAASVKQYYGYNYAYIYVWEQYRATHTNWDLHVHIVNHSDSGSDYGLGSLENTTRAELWGAPANTASECTHATGLPQQRRRFDQHGLLTRPYTHGIGGVKNCDPAAPAPRR